MTAALVTQSGAEVLFRAIPGARVTQAGVEYLHRVTPGVRVTQAGMEYLHRVLPGNRITQVGVEFLHKAMPCTTKLAQIWTITRTDGEVLRFTSLDRDLPWRGQVYQSCNSMTPSASESVAEVGGVGSIELAGLIASGAVAINDLMAGLFDNADVECWLVPWSGTQSPRLLLKGTFGQVEFTENTFKTDIIGDGAKLTQTPLISTLRPDCRFQFGDADCTKDLAPLTVTGTVEMGKGQRAFVDTDRAEAVGYFSRGKVTFTSGNNAGISAEIKEHAADGLFTLWPRLPFPIWAGDSYSMVPGCTNLKEVANGTNGCDAWANYVNYGGFRSVPGSDAIKKSADQKTGD